MPRGYFQSHVQREARQRRVAEDAANSSNAASFAVASAAARVLAAARKSRRDLTAASRVEALDPADLTVKRELLLSNIKRSQARDKYCWTLPVGMVGFTLWCLGMAMHAQVERAATVEVG